MRMPNIDDRDMSRRVDDGRQSTGTDEIKKMEQCITRKGEMMKETRRKASFAVGSTGMK